MRSWNARFGEAFSVMDQNRLQLKFGTALFTFRSEEQMKCFLESNCYMKKGRIHLHHGDKFHYYTELAAGYLKNVPKGVKVPNYTTKLFQHGDGKKPRRGEGINLDLEDYAEQDD